MNLSDQSSRMFCCLGTRLSEVWGSHYRSTVLETVQMRYSHQSFYAWLFSVISAEYRLIISLPSWIEVFPIRISMDFM